VHGDCWGGCQPPSSSEITPIGCQHGTTDGPPPSKGSLESHGKGWSPRCESDGTGRITQQSEGIFEGSCTTGEPLSGGLPIDALTLAMDHNLSTMIRLTCATAVCKPWRALRSQPEMWRSLDSIFKLFGLLGVNAEREGLYKFLPKKARGGVRELSFTYTKHGPQVGIRIVSILKNSEACRRPCWRVGRRVRRRGRRSNRRRVSLVVRAVHRGAVSEQHSHLIPATIVACDVQCQSLRIYGFSG